MMVNEGVTLDSDMVWYLEIGASNHMREHKYLFVDIQEIEDEHGFFGDSTSVPVKGRRKICFLQKDEKECTMEDIYYVSNLKNNILNMRQLLKKGCSIIMKDRMLYLKVKNGQVLAHVEMTKSIQERCLQVNMEDKT